MSKVLNFNFNQPLSDKEDAIIRVLSDAIIYKRISESVFKMMNAVDNGRMSYEFCPDDYYYGHYIAFAIMGFPEDEDLCSRLSKIFFDTIAAHDSKGEESMAIDLASAIYLQWMVSIRENSITSNTVALWKH